MEPSLSIQWSELQARTSSFLGWGPGLANGGRAWTTDEQFKLDGVIGSALRRFYHQALPEGVKVAYDWSFLRPTATLTLTEALSTVQLPDDCGAIEGPLTVLSSAQTSQPWRIEWRNNGQIRQMYSVTPEMTGAPLYVAEDPLKGTTATQGQRRQLLFFPLPDQDYEFQLNYYVNPDYLSGAFPYAYGGSQHAETIIQGCLAVAEKDLNDLVDGPQWQAYQTCLQASISIDRRNKPQKLGVNRDRSDHMDDSRRGDWHWGAPAATYNGGSFD